MTVTEKILDALQKKIDAGVSYYAIAKEVGVAQQVISRFHSAERKQIRSETIDRLCEYLGLELIESPAASGKPPISPASPTPTGKPAVGRSPTKAQSGKTHSKPAKGGKGKATGSSPMPIAGRQVKKR